VIEDILCCMLGPCVLLCGPSLDGQPAHGCKTRWGKCPHGEQAYVTDRLLTGDDIFNPLCYWSPWVDLDECKIWDIDNDGDCDLRDYSYAISEMSNGALQ